MNISEAKQIRIVDFLQSLGYKPVRTANNQYWYLSPYREEHTASFKVNDRLNEWYDFAISEGGGLIELVMRLYGMHTVSEALRLIACQTALLPPSLAQIQPDTTTEDAMRGIKILPLEHHALLSYLRSRYIVVP